MSRGDVARASRAARESKNGALISLPVRRSLSDDVYQALVTMLMDRVIPPGEPITIDDLARRLSVSPTPIRESLARLESEGLVYREQHRGYFSSPELTERGVDDLFQFRLLLEPWNAAEAARRRTGASAAGLQEAFASFDFRTVGEDYSQYRLLLEHDARLHGYIAEMAGNTQIRNALNRTHAHLHLFRLRNRAAGLEETQAEHGALVDAIVAGDAAASRTAMTAHLRSARHRFPAEPGDDED
jgi:DNA-binding GntR family transcriptional regulator